MLDLPREGDPDMEAEKRALRALMRKVDVCYSEGAFGSVLELEEELERRLWSLEYALEAFDEDEDLEEDDGDPDAEVGVEEQFVALWHAYCSGNGSFGGCLEASEGHLLDVLQSACLSGMAPKGLRVDSLPPLLPIARDLARERRALVARYRAHSRRLGR